MNVFIGTEHLKTLCELQALAEKHNCKINFGFRTSEDECIDEDVLKHNNVKISVINALNNEYKNNITLKHIHSTNESMWFELYDKTNGKYNVMTYSNNYLNFEIEKDYDYEEDENTTLNDFIEDRKSEYASEDEYFYDFEWSPTIITGFGYKNKHIDGRCYREGMAVKYFGDLVCKYLKEPMIVRTY